MTSAGTCRECCSGPGRGTIREFDTATGHIDHGGHDAPGPAGRDRRQGRERAVESAAIAALGLFTLTLTLSSAKPDLGIFPMVRVLSVTYGARGCAGRGPPRSDDTPQERRDVAASSLVLATPNRPHVDTLKPCTTCIRSTSTWHGRDARRHTNASATRRDSRHVHTPAHRAGASDREVPIYSTTVSRTWHCRRRQCASDGE